MSVQRGEMAVPEAAWFKSSHSTGDGGECVEVAWFKSSHSSGGGGECLEVAAALNAVLIRDSKVRSGPVLTVTPQAWAGLVRLAADRPV